MDPLTHIAELLRPAALKWKTIQGYGNWALDFANDDGFVFGIVTTGSCSITLPNRETTQFNRGDYILMAAPRAWTMSQGIGATPMHFDKLYQDNASVVKVGELDHAETTRIMAGHFEFDTANTKLIENILSPVIIIRAETATASRLRMMLETIDAEAMSEHLGQFAILQRLLEVMLIEALRVEAQRLHEHGLQGTLAALSDPHLGPALRALHDNASAAWTVASLAQKARMSRSVFAERFRAVLNMGPIEYLHNWRMAIAQDRLRYGKTSIAEIAFESGYSSISAFTIAFRRAVGKSPGRFRAEGVIRSPANAIFMRQGTHLHSASL